MLENGIFEGLLVINILDLILQAHEFGCSNLLKSKDFLLSALQIAENQQKLYFVKITQRISFKGGVANA